MSMMFFSDLPHDLFKSITEEYLQIDVDQLSCLDVAHCNRKQRSDLLALMRGTRASYPRKRIAGGALAGYLQWMVSRAVHVSRLEIGLAAFQDSRLSSLGPLPGVETVEIIHERLPAKDTDTVASNVVQFLNQFPVLGMLRVWQSMDAHQLLALQRLTCRLEGLELTRCACLHFSAAVVSAVLRAVGPRLKVLRCESRDGQLMPAIAEHCHNLTTLEITWCCSLPVLQLLVQVCSVNASTLKTLHLDADLSQTALLRVISSCPNLEYFKSTSREVEPVPFLKELFDRCARLKEVQLPQVTVAKTAGLMEISKQRWAANSNIIVDQTALLSVIPIPLCAYQAQFPDEAAARPALQYLGDRFGSTIRALELTFVSLAIDGDSVRDLLLKCPNLTEFKINPWSKAMSVLPSACRKIKTIHCGGDCEEFDNLLANYMALPDNCVTEFTCITLKSELLAAAVAEAFPHLHQLGILNSTTDGATLLLDLILSGKLKVKRIRLHSTTACWIAKQLTKRTHKHRQDGNCIVFSV